MRDQRTIDVQLNDLARRVSAARGAQGFPVKPETWATLKQRGLDSAEVADAWRIAPRAFVRLLPLPARAHHDLVHGARQRRRRAGHLRGRRVGLPHAGARVLLQHGAQMDDLILTLLRGRPASRARWAHCRSTARSFCDTLEDLVREVPGVPVEQWKIPGETAIPAGEYEILLTRSERAARGHLWTPSRGLRAARAHRRAGLRGRADPRGQHGAQRRGLHRRRGRERSEASRSPARART
jgi:hypothetical protein